MKWVAPTVRRHADACALPERLAETVRCFLPPILTPQIHQIALFEKRNNSTDSIAV